MNKILTSLLVILLSTISYGQITFEKGYYINNTNQKIECFIKNSDWNYNPKQIEIKLSEEAKPEIVSITLLKEFGIYENSKFVKRLVSIDRSSTNFSTLSRQKGPILEQETLLLKVLVEGASNLYQFVDGNVKRYFFSTDAKEIEPLIFKKYKTSNSTVRENNGFRQQLWTTLKCPSIKENRIEKLPYQKNSLISIFSEYNNCETGQSTTYESNEKRDVFNLTLRPRLTNASLSIRNVANGFFDTDFENETSFGIGLEAEIILPFNKNKWAIIIEPTYQNYTSEQTSVINEDSNIELISNVDYTSIEIPIGLRHYLFLNEKSKIFLNASIVIDVSSDSEITFQRTNSANGSGNLEINSQPNAAFGVGYKFNNTYGLEFRYQTNREILSDLLSYNSKFSSFSFIVGYSFL